MEWETNFVDWDDLVPVRTGVVRSNNRFFAPLVAFQLVRLGCRKEPGLELLSEGVSWSIIWEPGEKGSDKRRYGGQVGSGNDGLELNLPVWPPHLRIPVHIP